ncbi:hypothetical protein SAMN05444679_1272 [Variovorax sp. CF079]|uniref:hypothetical protein n=1 Tax=Variovorax sp. CF079 TaxID=1882774 RepID=UPI00089160A5|nr:hypothetical protein [Variovorax sp. CF079]SDE64656.1 hypothetical protein SAMN05444679_1272 [Variovorax sp. CF079]
MKPFRAVFCAAIALALAACASRSPESAGFSSEPLVDGNRLERHSILRAGNEAAFSTQQGRLSSNFAVSCDATQAWLLFASLGERRYPGGSKQYAERRELKEETARQLKAIPAVQSACRTAPDWREVRRSSDGIVTLIDLKGIQSEDGEFTFWGAFDYLRVEFDPPYQAPFGQKHERFGLSCAEGSYLQLRLAATTSTIETESRMACSSTPERRARSAATGAGWRSARRSPTA